MTLATATAVVLLDRSAGADFSMTAVALWLVVGVVSAGGLAAITLFGERLVEERAMIERYRAVLGPDGRTAAHRRRVDVPPAQLPDRRCRDARDRRRGFRRRTRDRPRLGLAGPGPAAGPGHHLVRRAAVRRRLGRAPGRPRGARRAARPGRRAVVGAGPGRRG